MAGIRQLLFSLANFASVPGSVRAARRAPLRSLTSLALVGRLFKLGVAPAVILDIGAHRGQFSSACVAYFPGARIFAIEALPFLGDRLTALFARHTNVKILTAAVGARPEKRTFHVNEYSHSSSFLPMHENHREAFRQARRTREIELRVTPVDDLLRRGLVEAPDLIKLDVQGFELEVLRGAEAAVAGARWIVVETAFAPLYEGEPLFPEVHATLQSAGFRFRAPVDFLTHPGKGVVLQMDALYERSDTAARGLG